MKSGGLRYGADRLLALEAEEIITRRMARKRAAKDAKDSLLGYARWSWPRYKAAEHHQLICEKLEAVERGECKRLMIWMPPRHGKTQLASMFYPAWYLGRRPDHQIISAAHTQDLADQYGRTVRNAILDPEFADVFPGSRLRTDSTAARRFELTEGGIYIAAGVGGPITGRGANLFLIDDPLKGRVDADSPTMRQKMKDWYQSVAYTRLMPRGAIVAIQTRWHTDDLCGWILAEHQHEKWDVLSLPAIYEDEDGREQALWPSDDNSDDEEDERYPLERLYSIRRTVGDRDWNALYMQKPVSDGGQILKKHWWQLYTEPEIPECDEVFAVLDTAFTADEQNDYSACTVWGRWYKDDRPQICLLYAWQERLEFTPLIEKIEATIKKPGLRPDRIIIEPKASGISVGQELRRRLGTTAPIAMWMPKGDKVARQYAVSSILEGGTVWVPARQKRNFEGEKIPDQWEPLTWAQEVIDQAAAGTAAAHDDLSDTVSAGLAWMRQSGNAPRPEEPDPWANERTYRGSAGHRAVDQPFY